MARTKARDGSARPTDLELEFLKVLWDRGPSTVREVLDAMMEDREIGYTTVLKMLQVMRDKGLVTCGKDQRPQVYGAVKGREVMLGHLAKDLTDRAFGGSKALLMMHALGGESCSAEELAAIRDLLDDLERRNES